MDSFIVRLVLFISITNLTNGGRRGLFEWAMTWTNPGYATVPMEYFHRTKLHDNYGYRNNSRHDNNRTYGRYKSNTSDYERYNEEVINRNESQYPIHDREGHGYSRNRGKYLKHEKYGGYIGPEMDYYKYREYNHSRPAYEYGIFDREDYKDSERYDPDYRGPERYHDEYSESVYENEDHDSYYTGGHHEKYEDNNNRQKYKTNYDDYEPEKYPPIKNRTEEYKKYKGPPIIIDTNGYPESNHTKDLISQVKNGSSVKAEVKILDGKVCPRAGYGISKDPCVPGCVTIKSVMVRNLKFKVKVKQMPIKY